MRPRRDYRGLDEIDRQILKVLQADCKTVLTKVGERVGLSAPSIVERVRKLESEGFISGYHARLNARRLGMDITAFVGISIDRPQRVETFEQRLRAIEAEVMRLEDVQECHHVTGEHTLLLKVKTYNTESLQGLIGKLRSIPGIERTETNVVLSTLAERIEVGVDPPETRTSPPRQDVPAAGENRVPL